MPGPGGQGGVPTGVRISVTLSKPDTFYVEIIKHAAPISLEGEKYVLLGSKAASSAAGKVTSTGWELTYDRPVVNDARAAKKKGRIFYFDIASGHFECSYAEENCPDPAAAEEICRSIRPMRAE